MTELKVILVNWFFYFRFKLSLKFVLSANWRSGILYPFFLLGQYHYHLLEVSTLYLFIWEYNVNFWFYLRLPVLLHYRFFMQKLERLPHDFDRLHNTISCSGIIPGIMLDITYQCILHFKHLSLNWWRENAVLFFTFFWNLNETFPFNFCFCWASRKLK